jgi:hypothetical protein
VLGYEGRYVGTAEFVRAGNGKADGNGLLVPDTFSDHQRPAGGRRRRPAVAGAAARTSGLRAAPAGQARSTAASSPSTATACAPARTRSSPSTAASADGMERGHVLALWRAGSRPATAPATSRSPCSCRTNASGVLFVFRVFDRVSYALIVNVQDPVRAGDRFTQP